METSLAYRSTYIDCVPQQCTEPPSFQRVSTENVERRVASGDVVQGRVLWLPSKEELPVRAVKRAHGKGAVEDGIYQHPVVIVSRPADEDRIVHFQLITSLQGRTLDQLYKKTNEFHTNRRTWYLPIAPSPDHPDATSRKAKKRFPTLELANGASLRWNSYVNIRHIYRIDWTLLRTYTNPENPSTQTFQFNQLSSIRILSKSRVLTKYEPGPQYQAPSLRRSISEPISFSRAVHQRNEELECGISAASDTGPILSIVRSVSCGHLRSDFWRPDTEDYRIPDTPPKVPPDSDRGPDPFAVITQAIRKPLRRILMDVKNTVADDRVRWLPTSVSMVDLNRPMDRLWVDCKGVMAVAIASV